MQPAITRRFRRRTSATREGGVFKKEGSADQSFFGNATHDTFFQPAIAVQRKCAQCEEEDKQPVHAGKDQPLKEDKEAKLQRRPDEKEKPELMRMEAEQREEEKVQRAAENEEQEKVQRAPDDKKEEETIQKKENGAGGNSAGTASYINNLGSKGQSLPKQQQHFFSAKMGYDFNEVKIHTDTEATRSAKAIHAQAYTYGNHVVFNEGHYRPGSAEGQQLIAHELVHVMQNNHVSPGEVKRRADPGFDIRGVFPEAAAYPHTIFYDRSSAMIPSSEWYKVNNIATAFTGKPVKITGTASEEGDDANNTAIINNRIAGVDRVLQNAGHKQPHTRNPQPGVTTGNKDYRQARNVEVEEMVGILPPGGTPPSTVDPCDRTVNPNADVAPCGASVLAAFPLGFTWILNAYIKLSAPDAATTSQANIFFPGIPLPAITANILSLFTKYAGLLSSHVCHSMCDPACSRPANMDQGTGIMTLCPAFINEPNINDRAETLIHESLHATPGVMSDDTAYLNTRLITSLTGAQALHNTDSYVLLIFSLNGLAPSAVPPADTFDPAMTAGENGTAKNALAFLEQWLLWSQYDTSLLYDAINKNIGRAGGWDPDDGDMAKLMHQVAPLFALTDPGATAPFTTTPVSEDRSKMAGMFDRYNRMMFAVYGRNLDMHKAGVSRWQPGLGKRIDLAPAFFALAPEAATKLLLALLVRSDGTVPSGLVDAYAEGGNKFRKHWGVGP